MNIRCARNFHARRLKVNTIIERDRRRPRKLPRRPPQLRSRCPHRRRYVFSLAHAPVRHLTPIGLYYLDDRHGRSDAITAANIIVNAYDPLMAMEHFQCQIGGRPEWSGLRAVTARVTAPRIDTRRADDERICADVNSRYDKSKFKGSRTCYRIKRAPRH